MLSIDYVRLLIKRLDNVPHINNFIHLFWNSYEHIKFQWYVNKNKLNNETVVDINPYNVYWVSPDDIKKMEVSSFDFIKDTCRIIDGDWDKNTKKMSDSGMYLLFKKRFHQDVPWVETSYYQSKAERLQKGTWNRYNNINEFETKLSRYDDMYHEFKCGNYYLQSELADKQKTKSLGDGGRAMFPSLTDGTLMRHEVAVSIGRDGSLLRTDGRHRIALAVLAELDEIPVRIVVRHVLWQDLRDKIGRLIDKYSTQYNNKSEMKNCIKNELGNELEDVYLGLDHPDLDIIFDRRM